MSVAHSTVTPQTPERQASRKPLAQGWLAVSAFLLLFANGHNTVAIAAWFAPVFLLRFLRSGGLWRLLAAYLVVTATWAFQFRGMVPAPQPILAIIWLSYGACGTLPYLTDRLLAHRIRSFAATLVFPCAATGLDYLLSLLPYGSWGSPAYTQYGNLPLMQLASVTGIYGITFLIAWFASVVNWAWQNDFVWVRIRKGVLFYAAVLVASLLLGSVRLMYPPPGPTVRVASISLPDINRFPNGEIERRVENATVTAEDVQQIREWSRRIDENLLMRASREADAGAKIIFWGEGNSYVLPEDEPWLMAQAEHLTLTKKIFLGLGNVIWHYREAKPLENSFVLINPDGELSWKYLKARPVPGGESALSRRADGRLKFVETPYGRLSGVICFDADFVQLLHQAGNGHADLVLIPSNDWQAIDPWHTQMAVFRGIEQGFNLVRHTSHGLSIAADYQGRVRGFMDHYQTSGDRQLIAEVPIRGVRTIYSRTDDLFSWLTLACLALLAIVAIRSS